MSLVNLILSIALSYPILSYPISYLIMSYAVCTLALVMIFPLISSDQPSVRLIFFPLIIPLPSIFSHLISFHFISTHHPFFHLISFNLNSPPFLSSHLLQSQLTTFPFILSPSISTIPPPPPSMPLKSS